MPVWLHRTNKTVLRSVASADLPEAIASYIEYPDLSAVEGHPTKYWLITGDVVSLVNATARQAIDAADASAARDELSNEVDQPGTFMESFALAVLAEINELRAEHGLSPRTIAQLKNAVRKGPNG